MWFYNNLPKDILNAQATDLKSVGFVGKNEFEPEEFHSSYCPGLAQESVHRQQALKPGQLTYEEIRALQERDSRFR